MKLNLISFQNNTNKTNLLEQARQSAYATNPLNNQKTDIVDIKNNKKDKYNELTKYSLIGLGALTIGFAVLKRANIVKFLKSIVKKATPPENKIPDIQIDMNKTPKTIDVQEVTNAVTTAIPPENKIPDIQIDINKTPKIIDVQEVTNAVTTAPKESKSKIIIKDGVKVYQKFTGEQSQKEVYVSKIYEKAKVKTLEMNLLGYYFKPEGLESKFIEGLTEIPVGNLQIYKSICKDFAADAFVGNRNILNSCKLDSQNNVIRVKLSDTLNGKLQDTQEHFGSIVDEISTFLNPNKYPQNAEVYSSLTREDLISSLERVTSIKHYFNDDILDNASNSLNGYECFDIINARNCFLKRVLDIAKDTEQNSLSIPEYVEKIKNEAIVKTIEKTEQYRTIKDIEHSIKNIENHETKAYLTSMLEKRIKSLTTEKKNPSEISRYEMGELLEKYTYKSYKPDAAEIKLLEEKYGRLAGSYTYILGKAVAQFKINSMARLANLNGGKYLDFWKNNPDKMALYVNSDAIADMKLVKFDEAAWDAIIGAYKTFFDKNHGKDSVSSIISYTGTGSYDAINGVLRVDHKIGEVLKLLEQKQNIDKSDIKTIKNILSCLPNIARRMIIGEDHIMNSQTICDKVKSIFQLLEDGGKLDNNKSLQIQEELKSFKNYMDKLSADNNVKTKIEGLKKTFVLSTKAEQNLKLGRNDVSNGFESLFIDGESLPKLISEADDKPELQEKILKYFNETKPSLFQPGFLSTSIKPYSTLSGNVSWDLQLGENVKYFYLDNIGHIFNERTKEAELLVHPGHQIKITGAKFENLKWKLTGIILPT